MIGICCCNQTSALTAVVFKRPRLDVGTQEHVETPTRTAGTGTHDLRSAGTPEYTQIKADKINPLRTVQCRSYIHRCREYMIGIVRLATIVFSIAVGCVIYNLT